MTTCEGEQVPALLVEFERVRTERLLVALRPKGLVADKQAVTGPDGTDDGLEVFLASGHVLEHHVLLNRGTVGQHTVYGEGGEEPSLDAAVSEHLRVEDIVLVGPGIALDDDAEHVEDGVAMAVERRSYQRIAVCHPIVLPLPADFLKRESPMRLERVDDPDVLVEYLSWFHAAKIGNNFETKEVFVIFPLFAISEFAKSGVRL